MDINVRRMTRHLVLPYWRTMRVVSAPIRQAIETAIDASEALHQAELRVVIEGGLPLPVLLHGHSPRKRAMDLFAQLRIWDTAHNSGVLIYVQCADRAIEIIADRGINERVEAAFWSKVCGHMQGEFRDGKFKEGILHAIAEITQVLVTHFPKQDAQTSELPNAPLIL